MDALWLFFILAILQGFTEVFPISSTGHLAAFRHVLNIPDFNLPLAAGLHGGSLIAIVAFFRKEILSLWGNFRASLGDLSNWVQTGRNPFFRAREHVFPYLLGVSLVPVALEGLSLRHVAEETFANKNLVLTLLILNGGIILLAALTSHGERTMKELSWKEYLAIGIVQGFAVLPGISRLGLVLCTGLWRRLKWQEALKLTFILAIPVLIGGLLVEGMDILEAIGGDPNQVLILIVGIILAALSSWLGLKLFTSRLLERHTFVIFGYYCMMFGSFCIVYLFYWR